MRIAALLLLLLFASAAAAQDWTMVGYDQQNSRHSPSTLPNNLSLLWVYQAEGIFYSSAVVADGRVFVNSEDTRLYVLNESTGELLWSYKAWSRMMAPAVEGNMVFIAPDDGTVYCLDVSDGSLIWSYQTHKKVASPPTLTSLSVIVLSGADVYSLEKRTGQLRWIFEPLKEWDTASVKALAADRGMVFALSRHGIVYGIDDATGNLVWSSDLSVYSSPTYYPIEKRIGLTAPAVAEGRVFIGGERRLFVLNEDTGSLEWSYEAGRIGTYRIEDPTVANGRTYVSSNDGGIYAIDNKKHELLWSYRCRTSTPTASVVADGRVIFNCWGSTIVILDEATGKPLWEYNVDVTIPAPPVVANQKVFVVSDEGRVYAFGEAPKSYITVSSQPAGAEVYIDGVLAGRTPLTEDLLAGIYRVRLSKSGYFGWASEVEAPKEGLMLNIALNKTPEVNLTEELRIPILVVDSVPPKANVIVDGQRLGQTPLSTNLALGYHTIKIEKSGYRDWVRTFDAVSGENMVNAELLQVTGRLTVSSNTRDSSVYIKGEFAGKTPLALDLPRGNYDVRVVSSGYREWTGSIFLEGDQQLQIKADLVSTDSANFVRDVLVIAMLLLALLGVAAIALRRRES